MDADVDWRYVGDIERREYNLTVMNRRKSQASWVKFQSCCRRPIFSYNLSAEHLLAESGNN